MWRILGALPLLLLASSTAFAADQVCPELTALQRWAGYLSWMGLVKVGAVLALAVGFCVFFWGFLVRFWDALWGMIKDIIDIVAHILSFVLVVGAAFVPEAYQLWPVLGGCILFGASVQMTIWLRQIKGNDPTGVFALYAIVWGAAAIYYNVPEVGFLAVGALMGVLGFSIIVSPLCYSFGFRRESGIAPATAAALMLLAAYCVARIFFPEAPAAVRVFESGVFWLGSLVGYVGLLILASKWIVEHEQANYVWIQLVTIVCCAAGVAVGMTFGINALAGMAGVMFVFYVASKFIEIEAETAMGWGLKLMLVGSVLTGAWVWASYHEPWVKTYLTMTLSH